MEFKVGDRVKCIEAQSGKTNIIGLMGTVVTIYPSAIGVRFDVNIGGHDCNQACPNGYGWSIPEYKLKLIGWDWEQRVKGGLNDV